MTKRFSISVLCTWVIVGLVVWELLVFFGTGANLPHFWDIGALIGGFSRFAGSDKDSVFVGLSVIAYSSILSISRAIIALLIGIAVGLFAGFFPLMMGGWHAVPVKVLGFLRAIPPLAIVFVWMFASPSANVGAIGYVAFCLSLLIAGALHAAYGRISVQLLQQVYFLGGSRWHQIRDVAVPILFAEAREVIVWSSDLLLPLCFGAELINSQTGGLGALCYQAFLYSNIGQLLVLIMVYFILGRSLIMGIRMIMRTPRISNYNSTLIS